MTEREASTLYEVRLKVSRTKQAMDAALRKYEEAEDEWHAALLEQDRLEGTEPPSFREVRGILKPEP